MITLTESYSDNGDLLVQGMDEQGRTSYCYASRFSKGAQEGARQRVRDDIKSKARGEITREVEKCKRRVINSALKWQTSQTSDQLIEFRELLFDSNELAHWLDRLAAFEAGV